MHIWYFVIGLGGAGLLLTLPMQALELHLVVDESWGFEAKEGKGDVEQRGSGSVTPVSSTTEKIILNVSENEKRMGPSGATDFTPSGEGVDANPPAGVSL